MKRPQVARATLVEYARTGPSVVDLAEKLGASPAAVREQIAACGERVARALRLTRRPIYCTSDVIASVDIAGLVRVGPRFELEVAPKFLGASWPGWREDFFYLALLSKHGRVLSREHIGTSTSTSDDLAMLVARAIIEMFWENRRRPLRTYRHERVQDFAADGEIEPESVLLPSDNGFEQRVVVYDQRNVFNAGIAGAAAMLREEVRDPQLRAQLARIGEVLGPLPALRVAEHRRVPNRARRWQALHDTCIDVLNGFRLSYDDTIGHAPGFVVETWRLWENLVTVSLRVALSAHGIRPQAPARLGTRRHDPFGNAIESAAIVIPDITVTAPNVLVDAKYKGRAGEAHSRISEADLYESLAFANATKSKRVVLVYPSIPVDAAPVPPHVARTFETVAVDDICITGMQIDVRGISNSGGLRRFADGLAREVLKLAT